MNILRALRLKASSKLRVDRSAVDDTAWGDVDLTALGNAVAEAWTERRITRAAVEEIYAYVEADAFTTDADGKRKLLVSKLHGPHHNVKGNKIVLSSPGLYALVGRLGQTKWGTSAVEAAKEHIRRHYNQLGEELPDSVKVTLPTGTIRVYRKTFADGTTRPFWTIRSSNSFEDNAGQIIPQAGLEWSVKAGDVLDLMWGHRGYLNLYHEPAATIGYCTGQMMMGRFLAEWGWFFDSTLAQKAIDWIEKEGDNAGASIEVIYDAARMIGDTFPDAVLIVGRALCHRDRAENSLTSAAALPVMEGTMSDLQDLAAIIGEDEAQQVLEDSLRMTAEYEKSGMRFKTEDDGANTEAETDEGEAVDEVAEGTEVVSAELTADGEASANEVEPEAALETDVSEKVDKGSVEEVAVEEGTAATAELTEPDSEVATDEKADIAPDVVSLPIDSLWDLIGTQVQETIEAALQPLQAQSAAVAAILESLSAAQADASERVSRLEGSVDKHEKTIGSAKVIFTGSKQQSMRPSQREDKADDAQAEAVSQITPEQVLNDNQAAVAFWNERRKKQYGY